MRPEPQPQHDLGVPARDVAWAVWASMVAMPILFLGVVLALKRPSHEVDAAPQELLAFLATATSVVGILLARVLPKRIPMRQGGGSAPMTALLRFVVAWSLLEAVAVFPLIAYLVTHDQRLLGVFALDVLALVLYFPSRSRWNEALPVDRPAGERLVH
jgi:hypothetical protein